MRVRGRLLAAFALMPLVDAALGYLGFPLVWALVKDGAATADPHAAIVFATLAGILGVLVTLCGALPVVSWLMRRGPVPYTQVLLAGLALGNAPFAVYVAMLLPFTVLHLASGTLWDRLIPLSALAAGTLRALAIGSAMGMLSATVFWFVGLRGPTAKAPV
jgi:hypothetical protein